MFADHLGFSWGLPNHIAGNATQQTFNNPYVTWSIPGIDQIQALNPVFYQGLGLDLFSIYLGLLPQMIPALSQSVVGLYINVPAFLQNPIVWNSVVANSFIIPVDLVGNNTNLEPSDVASIGTETTYEIGYKVQSDKFTASIDIYRQTKENFSALQIISPFAQLPLDAAGDIVLDADGDDITLKNGSATFASFTNSSGELVIKSGSTPTTAMTFSGANVTFAGTVTIGSAGISEAELEILDGATVTTDELNVLDGITSTVAELNIVDGDTSATSTTVADADRVVYNDAGTMKQVAVTDLDTYFSATSKTLTNKTLTTPVIAEIDNSSNITLDAGADIILDADGANIIFKDGGTSILDIANNSSDVELTVSVADKNFAIKGTDGSSAITALDIDMALAGKATFNGAVVVGGDLTVNGTTTTVNSTTVTIDDPIFTLGGDTAPGSDDNKDRGIEFRYHNGSAAKVGFFGFDDSTSKFTFIADATNSSEVFSGSAGNVAFGDIAAAGDVTVGDDLTLESDAAVLNFGADSDVSLTHVADTALLLNSSRQLQFGDSGTYIHQSADGVLDLVSDTEIEINATTIDINGNVEISGDLTVSGDDITMGTNTSGHIMVADGTNFNPVAVSGDVSIAANGAVTIANTAVETAMIAADAITEAKIADDAVESEHINDNVISGQTALTSGLATTDELLISDGGTIKRMDVSVLSEQFASADDVTALAIALG